MNMNEDVKNYIAIMLTGSIGIAIIILSIGIGTYFESKGKAEIIAAQSRAQTILEDKVSE